MPLRIYMVAWKHVCEDVISVRADSPEEALRQAKDGLGNLEASETLEGLSYAVFEDAEEPVLTEECRELVS